MRRETSAGSEVQVSVASSAIFARLSASLGATDLGSNSSSTLFSDTALPLTLVVMSPNNHLARSALRVWFKG